MPIYRGEKQWAPCLHSPKEGEDDNSPIVQKWSDEVLTKPYPDTRFAKGSYSLTGRNEHPAALAIETIGEICYGHLPSCIADIRLSFYSDMWVGVYCHVQFSEYAYTTYGVKEQELWTEADDFTLGLVKTVERIQGLMEQYPAPPDDEETDEELHEAGNSQDS